MKREYYFEIVENLLKKYPSEYSKNYYENKKSLIIEEKETKLSSGYYDNDKNIITIYDEKSLPHELFHMSFRDKEKVGKIAIEGYEQTYSNGVSFELIKDGQKVFWQRGLTEGFAEYLNEKCGGNYKGHNFEYFFTKLLISIYGEEILKFPFQNDPNGLLCYERFYDIFPFCKNLDNIYEAEQVIILISSFRKTFENIQKEGNKEDCITVLNIIKNTKQKFKSSIISCFKNIINEYENCEKPNITREELVREMDLFLTDSDYEAAFAFDEEEYSLRDNIKTIINEFNVLNQKSHSNL